MNQICALTQNIGQTLLFFFNALEIEARQKIKNMGLHQGRSVVAPVLFDGIDQRVMRVALAGRLAPFPIERNDERGTRQQIADKTRQIECPEISARCVWKSADSMIASLSRPA